MQNSGLKDLLSTVYAENTVGYMLDGKAVNRAVRGHFLVDDALNTLLLEKLVSTEDTCVDTLKIEPFSESEVAKANEIINELKVEKCVPNSLTDIKVNTMIARFDNLKTYLSKFRTARLWIFTYMDMIDNLK